jgi:hypothetical protein
MPSPEHTAPQEIALRGDASCSRLAAPPSFIRYGGLDLTDGQLVIDYEPAEPSPLATVAARIRDGYAGATWNGKGINSCNADTSGFALVFVKVSRS